MVHLDIHFISDFCMPTIYINWFTDLMEISVDSDELLTVFQIGYIKSIRGWVDRNIYFYALKFEMVF